MTILSREEFENCNPLNVSTQGVVWQSHLEAQAATIEALAEALHLGVDKYWASADSDSDDFKDDDERELANTLREKGWL